MSVRVSLPLLDQVEIASPCGARWEEMTGDARVRLCGECRMKVHNISALPREEAEALLRQTAGERLCIRLFRRADGTIITQDCPVGLAAVRARARRALVRVAALIGLVGAAGIAAGAASRGTWGERMRLRALKPFGTLCEWIAPTPAPVLSPMLGKRAWMGERCVPVQAAPPGAPQQAAPATAPTASSGSGS